MMGRRCAAIGSIPEVGRRQVRRSRNAAQKIHQAWAYFRTGRGRGRQIAAYFITELLATPQESRGMPVANKFGGTKQPANGLATMCRTSNLIPIRKSTWGGSS